ncbi:MAG TPA: ribonuclease HII [Gammaproteobacteria bacterium]
MIAGPTLAFNFVADDADVCGVDEAGRGPLAGPVVAAAVILDRGQPIEGLRDSKLLTALERVRLAVEIRRKAKAFAVAFASHLEIDGINILQASLLAMERAVLRLHVVPEVVRVDGRQIPAFRERARLYRAEPVIDGDNLLPEISAASILAKVCRDRLMRRLHRRYPQYGFEHNFGYPTEEHLRALEKFGPCAIHRATFAPVREVGAEHAR